MRHPDFDRDLLEMLRHEMLWLEMETRVTYGDELFAVPITVKLRHHDIPGWVPHNYGDLCANPKLSPKYLSNTDRQKWKATSRRKHR